MSLFCKHTSNLTQNKTCKTNSESKSSVSILIDESSQLIFIGFRLKIVSPQISTNSESSIVNLTLPCILKIKNLGFGFQNQNKKNSIKKVQLSNIRGLQSVLKVIAHHISTKLKRNPQTQNNSMSMIIYKINDKRRKKIRPHSTRHREGQPHISQENPLQQLRLE